ncbi:unnamed protein product [Cuscuta epithymum]|uniref:F-box domain-containing protein n=1 Tax=Cuscuta epithymum TaxID=186058 RepID=A0AAV0CVS9_9ASTE|nr:unnamed protein product [Cuscuta epithymum]
MPTLLDYSGDVEFYNGSPLRAADSGGIMLSLGCVDVYCPPRKRARVTCPYLVVQEENTKSSIEVLPDECLFEIFSRLSGPRERSVSSLVSKRWLTILSSVCHTKDLKGECAGYLTRSLEGKKASDIRLQAISVGTSSRGGLGKLYIRGSHGVTNVGLLAIARACPSLKVLSLWNVSSVSDEGLYVIAKGCHSLEKLDLSHCTSISNKGLLSIAENCPNLTSLTVESCPCVGNEGIRAIGRRCPELRSLTVKDCLVISDEGIAGLLSSASSVTKVKLHGLSITDFSLAVIGHYGNEITRLDLGELHNVTQKGFWVMGNAHGLQKLTSLTISSCRGITDLSLEELGKGCLNLKHICLRKCLFVSDFGLSAFTKAKELLEILKLEECNRVTRTGLLNAVSNCRKLKSISVTKCYGVNSLDSQIPFMSSCGSLRSLDLDGLSGITDLGLIPLIKSCEAGLVKVNLSNCPNLTDEVVVVLAQLHGRTLEVLNLDGCPKITDTSLTALAENCVLLNDLDVSRCSVTDSGVAALAHGVQRNLQILSLSCCGMVTEKSLPCLENLGKSLLGLNLQNCNSMGSSAIQLLVENLWRCDILS